MDPLQNLCSGVDYTVTVTSGGQRFADIRMYYNILGNLVSGSMFDWQDILDLEPFAYGGTSSGRFNEIIAYAVFMARPVACPVSLIADALTDETPEAVPNTAEPLKVGAQWREDTRCFPTLKSHG